MATAATHTILKTNGKAVSEDGASRCRVEPGTNLRIIARPWGGTIAMAQETHSHHFQDQHFDHVLKVMRSGDCDSASTLGRGDSGAGSIARITIKTKLTKLRSCLLRITPLSLALIVVVFVAMATVVVSAHAKTHSTLVLNVPFQFTVGDRLLLPGSYRFEQLLDSAPGLNIIAIRSADGGTYQAAVTTTTRADAVPRVSRLVFKRYGNTFFLSQVWTRGKLVGLLLYPSRGEARLAAQRPANEEVSVPVVTDSAVLATALNSRRPPSHSSAGHGQSELDGQ
jgi:hypothetical protein